MKLSCNVARDLLPLYHDGVCSQESRALVEAHLSECAECGAMLKALRGELEVPHEAPDDLAPLERIEQNVRKGRKRALLKGVAAVLAVVLIVFAGVNVWWFTGPYAYYQRFAGDHGPLMITQIDAEGNVVSSMPADEQVMVWIVDDYQFHVTIPQYLRDNGSVQVSKLDKAMLQTKDIRAGKEIETVLYVGRELYTYSVHLTVIDRIAVSGQAHLEETRTEECVMLDKDLNQVYLDHWDEETIARQDALYAEYRLEIERIVQAAQSEWPFLAE